MTSKEFVKEKYPQAFSQRLISGRIKGLQDAYYLIWSHHKRDEKKRLGEGKTESSAWVDAKKKHKSNIKMEYTLEEIKQIFTNPKMFYTISDNGPKMRNYTVVTDTANIPTDITEIAGTAGGKEFRAENIIVPIEDYIKGFDYAAALIKTSDDYFVVFYE